MGKKASIVDKAMSIKEDIHLIFDKSVKHDPYLKLSAKNALIKRGYEPDISGVEQFQYDECISKTGKIGLEDEISGLGLMKSWRGNDVIWDIGFTKGTMQMDSKGNFQSLNIL